MKNEINNTIPMEFTPSCSNSLRYCRKNIRIRSGREKVRPISMKYLPTVLNAFIITHTICLQMYIISRWTVGYVTREIMLLEFSSSIMCLILAGKVGSNIASELGTMRVTQQIDALEIMGVNSANYLILPKIAAMVTVIPILVTFSIFAGIIGAFCTCWFAGVMNAVDLEYGLQYMFNEWFIWAGIIKSLFFAFIIASVSAFFGYTVEGGSIAVGKASTDSVVSSSVLILFADLILTKLLMG